MLIGAPEIRCCGMLWACCGHVVADIRLQAHFKTLDNMTSPEAVAGQSYDWWCLNSQVTLQTRAGQRYGVTSDQLDEHMPLWPTVKLAMAERGAASKFHRPEEYGNARNRMKI